MPSSLRLAPCGAVLIALAFVSTGQAADDPCSPAADKTTAASAPATPGRKAKARPKLTPAPGAGRITVQSDDATLLKNGDADLTGNVHVHQDDSELIADEVEFNSAKESFRVKGAVEYRTPDASVKGTGGTYSRAEGATFENAEFDLGPRPGHGTAAAIALLPDGRIDLTRVTFTTCPATAPAWRIQARDLDLDPKSKEGTARGAEVDFEGVPIAYLPWMSFPLGDERKSGFLFPDFGHTTRSGFQLTIPYYFNLAPNYDLLFEPVLYTSRGVDAAGQFRFLTEESRGTLSFDFLPDDRLADADPLNQRPSNRSLLRFSERTNLPDGWRLNVKAADVSDDYYFEDFGQGPETTSIVFLPRVVDLSYRDEHWNLLGELQNLQTVDATLALAERPYSTLPRLVANGSWGLPGSLPLSYGFDSELVNFQRSIGVNGWRLDATPHLGIDWNGPGWFVRPSTGYRFTQYELDHTAPGAERSPTRALPTFNFDTGLYFERLSGSQNQRLVTLEPRVLYTYTPFRDQDALPIFDTTLPDLNLVELFRTNRYVGADRVSDANQMSVGVTSRLLDAANGSQFIAGTLGQIYYFTPTRVALPVDPLNALPVESIVGRSSSDLVGQVDLTAYKNWNVNLGMQWNPALGLSERTQILLQYRPDGERVVNIGYRFQRGLLEQAEFSGAWPVAKNWNLYTRAVYSLLDHSFIERFVGFEYRACCWKVRTVMRRYVSTRAGQSDTAVMVQLELNGLASVGTPATTFLQQAIRGYSPPRAAPDVSGSF